MHRDPAAGEHARIHRPAGNGDGAGQVRTQLLDHGFQLAAAAPALAKHGVQHGAVLAAAVRGGAAHAQHRAHAACLHGAHGLDLRQLRDPCGDLVAHGGGIGKGRLVVQRDAHAQLRAVHRRHEREAARYGQHDGEDEQRHGAQQHGRLMPQRGVQRARVGAAHARFRPAALDRAVPQQAAAHRRHERQRHDEACKERIGDRERHIRKELARQPLHEHDGHEHAHRRQRGGGDGRRHLRRAGDGRAIGRHALAAQAVDVLDDDDGIVHQHPDADGQPRHGDDVERHAGEIHQHDGERHADRDGQRHDQRRP